MTLLPEVHEALRHAVAHPSGPRRAPWWRRRTGAAMMVSAGALTIGAAASAGPLGLLGESDDAPRPAKTAVPAEQRALLGVLRREQTRADRSDEVQRAVRLLRRDHINGVHEDGIRLLGHTRDGSAVILVPTQRVGTADEGYPSTVRRRVLCLMVAGMSQPLPQSAPAGMPRRLYGASQSCGTAADLRRQGIGSTNIRLVPDGVARVRVRFRRGRVVEARVRNNVYVIDDPELAPSWPVRWLDRDGREIPH